MAQMTRLASFGPVFVVATFHLPLSSSLGTTVVVVAVVVASRVPLVVIGWRGDVTVVWVIHVCCGASKWWWQPLVSVNDS
jgi:hypothetical protein